MAKNADLSNAKNAKNDEFYTQLEDINAEYDQLLASWDKSPVITEAGN